MTLMYPLGLIGLIGIPILIIIYLIKNKYTEQIIASTYIWRLSEKFLKKRNPIKIVGIISLILQILIVACASLAIAHPVFIIPASANDYCYVLDGSGSMNITQDGKTRFELGKEEITSLVNGTLKGCTYTLIYVDDDIPEILCKETESKELVLNKLAELKTGYSNISDDAALRAAQDYFNSNPSVKTYLVTDKSFQTKQNVEIINVSSHEENYALSEITEEISLMEGTVTVNGKAVSYESNANLKLELYVDGKYAAEQNVEVNKLEYVSFTFENVPAKDLSSYRVVITNPDALKMDSEVTVYFNNDPENVHRAMIVTDKSDFFISSMLKADGIKYETVATKDYQTANKSDIELFIFDSYSPASMPENGEVWFFNPTDSIPDSGFTVGEPEEPGLSGQLVYTDDSRKIVQTLLTGIDVNNQGNAPHAAKYMLCQINDVNLIPLMYHGNNPVVFTGIHNGQREVVFAFEFGQANAALAGDFLIIMYNLINYTFPEVITQTLYTCGEEVSVNVLANCDSITVKSPSGEEKLLDTDDAVALYTLKEVGEHSITVKMKDSASTKTYYVYSQLPEEERATTVVAQSFNILGEPQEISRDGRYDDLLYLLIIIAVLVAADWMVYCYEQYQLR